MHIGQSADNKTPGAQLILYQNSWNTKKEEMDRNEEPDNGEKYCNSLFIFNVICSSLKLTESTVCCQPVRG